MSVYSDAVLADNPALYWRLGEPVGTGTVQDQTANNRDGTVTGATLGVTGLLTADADTAASLDGTDDRITSAYNPFAAGSQRTYEFWATRDNSTTIDVLMGSSGGSIWLYLFNASTDVRFAATGEAIWAGAWPGNGITTHVVLTFNDSTNTAELYINGVSKGTKTDVTGYPATPGNFQVGTQGTSDHPWPGDVDEVAIYESILSAARVLYHYQAGTNTLPQPEPPPSFKISAPPPLDLHAELVAPDGTRYRWSSERTDPGQRPQGVSFASKRYEGWERGTASLSRPVDRDYPDLGLFDGFNLIGYDGTVAYEGMLGQVPRTTPHGIGVETTGWMAHARHRKFKEVYVDRDRNRWGPVSAEFRLNNGTYRVVDARVAQAPSSGAQVLTTAVAGPWSTSPGVPRSTAMYYAAGVPLKRLYWAWKRGANLDNTNTNWVWQAMLSSTSNGLTFEDTSGTLRAAGPATGQKDATGTRYVAFVDLLYANVANPNDNVEYALDWTHLAVYGDHGLPYRTDVESDPFEPWGFYASDIIRDICSRWCPRLNAGGVQDTTWVIPHAAWIDRIHPYDAWLELNKYHLWELEVWEDRTLWYRPADLTDYQWEVRTTDPGVQVTLQGDSTDHLANYCVVQFTNLATGEQDEVSPDTHPELRDTSVENPANRHGLDVEFGISLSDPTDPDSAAQIGRVKLAENNQPRAIGTITFKGHIRDRAGHWQQGWKVRAGQTVAITNWPNNRARMIGEVQWDHQTKTGTIAVDSTLLRVDAFLDRQGTALRAAGL